MIKDSFRTIMRTPANVIAIVASFKERDIDNPDGTVTTLKASSSVHEFRPLTEKHELFGICPKTLMSSFTVSKPDANFRETRFDYLVPTSELQAFLTSNYVLSEKRAIQVVKRFSDKFLIQLQAYSDEVYPNFVVRNQNDKASALQFLSTLPVEPIIEVPVLPEDTTKKRTAVANIVAPANVSTMSNEELLALLQNPSAS